MQPSWLKKRMLGLLITAAGVIGFLGIVVGFIVIALFMPIINITTLING